MMYVALIHILRLQKPVEGKSSYETFIFKRTRYFCAGIKIYMLINAEVFFNTAYSDTKLYDTYTNRSKKAPVGINILQVVAISKSGRCVTTCITTTK